LFLRSLPLADISHGNESGVIGRWTCTESRVFDSSLLSDEFIIFDPAEVSVGLIDYHVNSSQHFFLSDILTRMKFCTDRMLISVVQKNEKRKCIDRVFIMRYISLPSYNFACEYTLVTMGIMTSL